MNKINNMDNILKEQYLLFNKSYDFIDLVTDNKYIVYTELNNIIFEDNINYNLENIVWKYDENNYRIPYYNDIKINYLILNKEYNIYDFISSNSIIPNEEIICGENIQKLCDIVLFTNETMYCNPNNNIFSKKIQNMNDLNNLDSYKSIFVKGENLQYFYEKFNKDIDNKIVVSHNSDYEINDTYVKYLDKVNKQMSQNCLFQHEKLVTLPIGIENRQWFDHNIFHHIRKCKNIKKTKNIYFLFSFDTNSSRIECYNSLKDKLEWNEKKSKEEYFVELKKHKYAICPRGNGLDTHRLWECFYLDVIPIIIEKDFININNLPIIILKTWNDLNEKNIQKEFNNIKNSKICLNFYNNFITKNI
jgi:hypothetical protein